MTGKKYDYKRVAVDGFKIHRKEDNKIQIEFLLQGRSYVNSMEYEMEEVTLNEVKKMLVDYTSANARVNLQKYNQEKNNEEVIKLDKDYNGFKIYENGLNHVELLQDGEAVTVADFSAYVHNEESYKKIVMGLLDVTSRNARPDNGEYRSYFTIDWISIISLIQNEIEK